MRVLMLGGRAFLGRFTVESLLRNGHQVTLFNRNRTNTELFSELEQIVGDRRKDFHLFAGQNWDCVIDTSGYFPDDVSKLAHALRECTNHYIFISSCSVYDHESGAPALDESAPIVNLDVDPLDTSWATYGARKFLCEQAIEGVFSGQAAIVRPGLIVGPYDTTYRFPYWGERVVDGGEILAPGTPDCPLQIVDVRDLAEWLVEVAEKNIKGQFNVCGPKTPYTLGEFLNTAVENLQPSAKLTWVSEKFLREQNVMCWSQLPLWVYKDSELFLKRDAKKAISQGLKFRPIGETLSATLAWSKGVSDPKFREPALSRERERELLKLALLTADKNRSFP